MCYFGVFIERPEHIQDAMRVENALFNGKEQQVDETTNLIDSSKTER